MKKRYKLKRKTIYIAIIITTSCLMYHILGILGAFESKKVLASIFILFGWVWLLFGQIIALFITLEK